MKDQQILKKPFFAQFLEAQLTDDEQISGGQGGDPSPTSVITDNVTIPERDNITKPSADTHQTMKYPSDSDEI